MNGCGIVYMRRRYSRSSQGGRSGSCGRCTRTVWVYRGNVFIVALYYYRNVSFRFARLFACWSLPYGELKAGHVGSPNTDKQRTNTLKRNRCLKRRVAPGPYPLQTAQATATSRIARTNVGSLRGIHPGSGRRSQQLQQ